MSDKKNKNSFNPKKAKDYYLSNEHSYEQDSKRLSQRGIRPDLESQIESSYGESTKKKDLSKIISSKESSGSEFGGPSLSSPTVKEHANKTQLKKESNKK